MSFPKLRQTNNFQKKEGETQEVDATPEFNRDECIVSGYSFSELPEGIQIVENSGKLTIETSSSI